MLEVTSTGDRTETGLSKTGPRLPQPAEIPFLTQIHLTRNLQLTSLRPSLVVDTQRSSAQLLQLLLQKKLLNQKLSKSQSPKKLSRRLSKKLNQSQLQSKSQLLMLLSSNLKNHRPPKKLPKHQRRKNPKSQNAKSSTETEVREEKEAEASIEAEEAAKREEAVVDQEEEEAEVATTIEEMELMLKVSLSSRRVAKKKDVAVVIHTEDTTEVTEEAKEANSEEAEEVTEAEEKDLQEEEIEVATDQDLSRPKLQLLLRNLPLSSDRDWPFLKAFRGDFDLRVSQL